ncbi:MAG: hypothetical protein JSR45_10915 [Proteobacteria bacterium]|nr:hypothetical protein [Pseudomonadota bacterium]
MRLLGASSVLALTAAAMIAGVRPASAAPAYAMCLHDADAAACIAARAAQGAPVHGWSDRMDDLVRSGSTDTVADYAGKVRPLANLVRDVHISPTGADIALVETIDPEAAATLRGAGTGEQWRQWSEAYGGETAGRALSPDIRAGFVLAAAAYRSADPFADPAAKAALDKSKDEAVVLQRAMRSVAGIAGGARGYGVAPPGARAVLARASTVAKPGDGYLLTLASYARWLGDDAAAAAALERLSPQPGAGRDWRTESALWAALGRPQEAAAALKAAAAGPDRDAAAIVAGRAWLKAGDKAQAAVEARMVLADAADDPTDFTAAIRLLADAGAGDEALTAARALGARAQASDDASKSAAFALASEAMTAVGRRDEACNLARRSLGLAGRSAAAQNEKWSGRYHADAPVNVWLGPDFSDTGVSVDDLRRAYRDRATRALDLCGAAGEAQAARGGKGEAGRWDSLVALHDPNASTSARLREAADTAAADPALAQRLAEAVKREPEPDDPLGRLLWRDGVAAAQASAGQADAARATYAAAVRGLDEVGNPDDQRTAAFAMARDGRLMELRLSGKLTPANRLP